ncbi:hypothetical protein K493DRAFT_251010 [Basidiobolus meristosporus CBS 931.73]|uniref:RING-type domain-containing protein n=1 Tax=Basidiobolus meristosporus CBS 931.73 TaxID=1314790 RepID=A0A1Y1ZBD3_9FUNG|nr:hypothetical protein K493DRAFT_251010 [Basidiobolus meristosporus CBS 931.73]|eukprot:ORY07591.1 hypothetical protein K493DRAFT_251010 [Basidiobolus meristosporus CBS 931.73]
MGFFSPFQQPPVNVALDDARLEQLKHLFPDGDVEYFRECLKFYKDQHVERITEKILSNQFGYYPRRPPTGKPNASEGQNYFLKKLNEIFPDCEIRCIREKIKNLTHSHVEQAIDYLLDLDKNARNGYPQRLKPGIIDRADYVRSSSYIKGAKHRLYNEFPFAFKSSIKAVMAELNNDYVQSYDSLSSMSSLTWWTSWLTFMQRKPYNSPEMYDPELLKDVDMILSRERIAQTKKDEDIAKNLNFSEYQKHNELFECGCCFSSFVFEDMCTCREGHMFCCDCLSAYTKEGLFGQGNLRGKPIPCMDSSECTSTFSLEELERVLSSDIYHAYADSIIEEEFKQLNVELVKCPFCSYCEFDDDPLDLRRLRLYRIFIYLGILAYASTWIATCIMDILEAVFCSWSGTFVFGCVAGIAGIQIRRVVSIVQRQLVRRRKKSNILYCQNPRCGKCSCLACGQEHKPLHRCHEKEQDKLRLYVEQAMADAVKRTCPKCQLSFTKSDGCNKMTCRCGYQMCYICRKDIRQESYSHFCDHFRDIPGQSCTACNKCDLYKVQSEEKAVKEAATRAHAEFLAANPEITHSSSADLDHIGPGSYTLANAISIDYIIEQICDLLIDHFFH